jgi:hypothetical protein
MYLADTALATNEHEKECTFFVNVQISIYNNLPSISAVGYLSLIVFACRVHLNICLLGGHLRVALWLLLLVTVLWPLVPLRIGGCHIELPL